MFRRAIARGSNAVLPTPEVTPSLYADPELAALLFVADEG